MTHDDLTIVGFEASSREDANDLADEIDALAEEGTITVRELAVAHKNAHGRVKVHYITDPGAGIGAAIGAGWGAVGLGTSAIAGTLATGGLLPVLVGAGIGLGLATGVGAAIGHAFDRHHDGARDVLEKLSAHVEAGRAVTFTVVDPSNADWLTAAFPHRTAHVATLTGEEQERVAAELADQD
jgi:uncharacterized membrane protein